MYSRVDIVYTQSVQCVHDLVYIYIILYMIYSISIVHKYLHK